MKKNGYFGAGSISLVMIFAVLCLTVFALLTFSSARSELELAKKNGEAVKEYYSADALACAVINELLTAEDTPESVLGCKISSSGGEVEFICPAGDTQGLYVRARISDGEYRILAWYMTALDSWQSQLDESLPVWTGE